MAEIAKRLRQAVDDVATLSQADQERIDEQLLSHVEKLRALRADIDQGIRSLDTGEGRELNIEDFIRQANRRLDAIFPGENDR